MFGTVYEICTDIFHIRDKTSPSIELHLKYMHNITVTGFSTTSQYCCHTYIHYMYVCVCTRTNTTYRIIDHISALLPHTHRVWSGCFYFKMARDGQVSYYRMCSLTIKCVLLLLLQDGKGRAGIIECVLLL